MKSRQRRPFAPIYDAACAFIGRRAENSYGLEIDNAATRQLKGPVVVLANHASNLDYIYVALAMRPLRLNYLVSTYFLRWWPLRLVGKAEGIIPKLQFVPDVGSVKRCMQLVRDGGNLAVFPAGQVSYTGAGCKIEPSIAKLVKKLAATVVTVKLDGAHLSKPKWSAEFIKSRVLAATAVLLTPAQLAELSEQEIFARIDAALAFNDYEYQRRARVPLAQPRAAAGLENVLFRCLNCGADYTMQPRGSSLVCRECGYTVSFNEYSLFGECRGGPAVADPAAWFAEIRRQLAAEIAADPEYKLSSPCVLMNSLEGKKGYYDCGEGTVTLTRAGIAFSGIDRGKPLERLWPLGGQTGVTHTEGLGFDVHDDPTRELTFSPPEKRCIVKFVEAFDIMKELAQK